MIGPNAPAKLLTYFKAIAIGFAKDPKAAIKFLNPFVFNAKIFLSQINPLPTPLSTLHVPLNANDNVEIINANGPITAKAPAMTVVIVFHWVLN